MGTQCWVFIAISTVELLICIKFGRELFAKTEKINIVMWLVFQLVFSFLIVCVMIIRRNRNVEVEPKSQILANLPSDENSKTYNFVNSNGKHVVQREGLNPRASVLKSSARVTRSMARGDTHTADGRAFIRRK